MTVVAAIDLGAESGRVISGTFSGERIDLDVIHRFENDPIDDHGQPRWNIDGLWSEVKDGLEQLGTSSQVSSVGVDAWGVDFGLYRGGRLVEAPLTYRDSGRQDGFEYAMHQWGPSIFHAATGAQAQSIYSIYALIRERITRPELLKDAESLLMIPDIFHRLMSGSAVCEYTAATTTGMFNMAGGAWAEGLLDLLDIPTQLLPDVVGAGTDLGSLRIDSASTGLAKTRVITPASHDTASAVLAIPRLTPNTMFISSGTWSLAGIVRAQPIIDRRTQQRNLTNEGGYARSTMLLENVVGLWVLQECRRHWQSEGTTYDYSSLVALAAQERPLRAFVDLGEPQFMLPGDMPSRIRAACARHGMPEPRSHGAIARVIIDSLALAYRRALDNIESVTNEVVGDIAVVGGGIRNQLLQQATASATGRPVVCWSQESSALGSVGAQLVALAELSGVEDIWSVVEASVPSRRYEPEHTDLWGAAVERLREMRRASSASVGVTNFEKASN